MIRIVCVPLLLLLAAAQREQAREATTCETNIVSATVAATYCSHASGNDDVVDLLILWRGGAGWFQRGTTGRYGTGGSHTFGGGTAGHVTDTRYYGTVEIRYDADFDTGTLKIGGLGPIARESNSESGSLERPPSNARGTCGSAACPAVATPPL